jgi:site-specific recombinase XerD
MWPTAADHVFFQAFSCQTGHTTLQLSVRSSPKPPSREEIFVLNRYFIRPTTVDRIRASWIGDAIERYVAWLGEQDYAARNVFVCVPILLRFGQFAQEAGARSVEELPAHVKSFVETWLKRQGREYSELQRQAAARGIRNPIQQLLRLILPQQEGDKSGLLDPFAEAVPGFFGFLRQERGLRAATLVQYRHYLQRLQEYLRRVGRPLLPDLPPAAISAFITESGQTIDKRSVQSLCSILKVFFRYLYRVGLMTRDLGRAIESPRRYSLASLPRSITWSEVERMLQKVDRRSAVGKRDYAILLLLVTYGLLPALQLKIPSGVVPPHLHCLRHSFAVGTLLRWYRAGVDPMARLLDLSTFLGHVSPSSTAVYLTITTELLECASERFALFAANSRKECAR